MGRSPLGVRKQVNVRLPPDLIDAIDQARGPISRDKWMERASRLALRPIARALDKDVQPVMHIHTQGLPLRTEIRNGEKIRVYRCSTCTGEMT